MPAQLSTELEAPVISLAGVDYPPDLTLVRRQGVSRLGPEAGTALDWLMSGAGASLTVAGLLDGVVARLVAMGAPIERATLHMSTLHPQLLGVTSNWRGDLGTSDEVEVNAHVRETADYLRSPIRTIFETGEPIRLDPLHPTAQALYPILRTLGAAGYTDYWALPLRSNGPQSTILTLATRVEGGFPFSTVTEIETLLPALALNVEILSRGKIAENILDAYLGRRIGKRVLAGDIKRGSGETIDAVVWISDMRDFTGLSDRIESADMIGLLNRFFESLVDAVQGQGGEVLKFVGDGMLAIFPITQTRNAEAAAAAALAAARDGLAAIDAINDPETTGPIRDVSWRPLGMAIALHRGPVFFGNIGARDRLDFTVIGQAVNLAARVEPLSKQVGRRLLLTRELADLVHAPLDRLGDFPIRGFAEPATLFGLSLKEGT